MKKYLVIAFLAGAVLFYLLAIKNQKQQALCGNNCKDSFALQVDHNTEGVFNQVPVYAPTISLEQNITDVLGTQDTANEKLIYVNLSTQTLMAYEGKKLFMKTPISSGLWGRTPTGEYTIWTKIRSTRMTGGSGADYYNLPNVPYVMFFSNNQIAASRGFSIHGTYWHNNFGHRMSHGCVNMKTTDAGKLFNWVDKLGTKIIIYQDTT